MNEQTRAEFEELKRKQAQLEQELASLSKQLRRFEFEMLQSPSASTTAPAQPVPAEKRAPVPVQRAVPPPIPPIIPATKPAEPSRPIEPPKPPRAEPLVPVSPFSSADSAETARVKEVKTDEKRSFEMRLGTYWLVRVGIVMLLTGLVFFANFAYQNFIGKLGPAGKISLLYVASAALLGFGAWWQRKAAKESLRNYAQVLFAGGLAAVYFTTYAAHHIPNLRIIESAILDGALLLGWAAFIVWIADRRKSEVLALFAVALAYYTSVITRVGAFTLYSNLILTTAAVFFLVRNRWAVLSTASLIATYGSYAFWRFFDGEGWRWATPGEGLWFGAFFLVSYWILFAAAVFLSRGDRLKAPGKAAFLTFNNGAFFSLFLLTMLQVNTGGFWKFSLIYGTTLLALTEAARRFLPNEPLVKNSYLTQGLLLVTVGIISKFAGLHLALLLGAESVVLFTLGTARKNPILLIGSYLSGALATGWGIDGLVRDDWRTMLFEMALGTMMLFNAFWSARKEPKTATLIRPVPAFFSLLALISGFAATAYNVEAVNLPLALAVEAMAFTASLYLLRLRELVVLSQGYLLIAHAVWLIRLSENDAAPWWNSAALIAITVALSHWWQRQRTIVASKTQGNVWQGLYGLGVVAVLYFWLRPEFVPGTWLAIIAALAMGVTIYGVATRAWWIAAAGQILTAASVVHWLVQITHEAPEWWLAMAPLVGLLAISLGTGFWFARNPAKGETVREPLLQLAMVYRWAAALMLLWFVYEYVPARDRIWAYGVLGLGLFLLSGWKTWREVLLLSALYWTVGLACFWWPVQSADRVTWLNLLAIAVFLAQQRIAKRFPNRFQVESAVQSAVIIIGGLSLWLFVSRWMRLNASGFYLTASWSVLALALFVFGMMFRERMYRWLGLIVLAGALGRVVIFDVWKLETIFRILSFMALGIVLLVLGFLYNKYQEKLREWL